MKLQAEETMDNVPEEPTSNQKSVTFHVPNISGQLPITLALLLIIAMLAIWRPWSQVGTSARTITVTGQADITATPDEYTFTPEYQFTSSSQQQALSDSTKKLNEVVAKVKALGVADDKIKTNANGYTDNYYDSGSSTYYASLTITVDNKALAQKVQDYLLTTSPTGSVTPSADFSKAKKLQLTNSARDQATKDARAKADQSAHNLGFKIGKVKVFQDEPEDQLVYPVYGGVAEGLASGTDATSTPIKQGQNDLTYQVTVTYYIN
ncbi:MAG TPA: SIMPL domain-containing protein [Candidatus Saccharimonadales bacterium]|nr:SIMPL domain-containing protein [Candidatus Saccharimonadales bacterium]